MVSLLHPDFLSESMSVWKRYAGLTQVSLSGPCDARIVFNSGAFLRPEVTVGAEDLQEPGPLATVKALQKPR